MHVGWVGLVTVPEGHDRPTLTSIRRQFEERLWRAPRYRQKLASVPLGLHDPVWIDDQQFDIRRHVRQSKARRLDTLVETVFSTQLDRERPLWELWIADDVGDGRIGFVGKVHHCLVDGLAAVEFASLLLDLDPEGHLESHDEQWHPQPPPSSLALLAEGVRDRIADELDLVRLPARIARSPRQLFSYASDAQRVARALAHSLPPASRQPLLNDPLSPARCLGRSSRPFGDLLKIKRHHGATVNDVVLAISAGAMRSFLEQRGQTPTKLKTMVPVSVRDEAAPTGNAVSFVFIDLPCDEPDPLRRLRDVQMAMADRKRGGEPAGGRALRQQPRIRAAPRPAHNRPLRGRSRYLQPRCIEHSRPARAPLSAGVPDGGGLPGRAAVGSARAFDRLHDDGRSGVLRRLRGQSVGSGSGRCDEGD